MRRSSAHLHLLPARLVAVAGWVLCGCFSDPGQQLGPGTEDTGSGSTGESSGDTSGVTTGEPTGEPTGAPAGCGDARTDPGEECDFGEQNNGVDGNLCTADCLKNVCGDGYLALTEGCDDGNLVDDDACSNTCVLATCGDGVVGAGEACDDGNTVDVDACSNMCKLPFCGDGNVGAGEACDDGADNGPDQACTSTCTPALCGDGMVWTNVEECDDGNQNDGDMCSNVCKLSTCGDGLLQPGEGCDDGNNVDGDGCSAQCQVTCGDGVVDPGEACDDGNDLDGDTCSATCERLAFTVFVTSARYAGAFGGIAQADIHCNNLAGDAKLPGAGKYLAWLSDAVSSPDDRFHHSVVPYRRVDGLKIATDWSDLTDGDLGSPLSVQENGVIVSGGPFACVNIESLVWSGTSPEGDQEFESCNQWNNASAKGITGNALTTSSQWTQGCVIDCDLKARFYCFEQP